MSVIQGFFGGTRPPTARSRFFKSYEDTDSRIQTQARTVSLRIALLSYNLADTRKNSLAGHGGVMSDSLELVHNDITSRPRRFGSFGTF